MKAKKILYSILLVLFSLTLAVTLAVYFLIPESAIAQSDAATEQTQSGRPSFSGGDLPSMPDGSSGFSMPEGGFSFPSGETPDFSDGSFSFPDGEAPDGFDFSGSFPSSEGFPSRPDGDSSDGSTRPSRPDSGSSDGNGRRRPDSGSSDGTQTTDTGIASELETILPAWLFSAVLFVRQYWLWFLIGSAAAVVLCIVRLIFLARKSRKLKAMRGDDSDDDSTSRRKIAVWPAILLLIGALVLVAVLFPADSTQSTNEAVAKVEVLSGTVEQGSLTETLIESGFLAEQEAETVTLPAAVKLSAVCVQNGETVTEGQIVRVGCDLVCCGSDCRYRRAASESTRRCRKNDALSSGVRNGQASLCQGGRRRFRRDGGIRQSASSLAGRSDVRGTPRRGRSFRRQHTVCDAFGRHGRSR